MIQPFCSIYTKSYRAYEREPEIETAKPCQYYSNLKENFLPLEDSKAIYNAERDEAVLKDLYVKRLITTYQKSYCISEGKKSMVIDPNNLDADEYMVYFNHYYAPKTQPIPRPLETARRINWYCRFDNYYTGKSTYQEEIGYEAYKFFKKDYDAGKSRLFYKKQKAMQQKEKGEETNRGKEKDRPLTEEGQQKKAAGEKGKEKGKEKQTEKEKEEKICAFCCEKFGHFSSANLTGDQNREKGQEISRNTEEKTSCN